MSRIRRRSLQFESLEGKVLLSTGLANPATKVERAVIKNFHLNGALNGLALGSAVQNGFSVSIFLVQGHTSSMHRVTGVLDLVDPLIPAGKKPDLNNAALFLANKQGSVVLSIKKATTREYDFKVVSGTDSYLGVTGSGFIVILTDAQSKSVSYLIRLHTTSEKSS
jgi:hypothetical protein